MIEQGSLADLGHIGDVDRTALQDHDIHRVAPDIAYRRLAMVNAVFLGRPRAGDRGWVLVDAGLPGTAWLIRRAADLLFGPGARPAAIVVTHGHIDHIGALQELAEGWEAPVYAHPLEHAYLDGRAAYPHNDRASSGGLLLAFAHYYPSKPVDVRSRLHALASDGSLPALPGWRWLHTPGHSSGHVSLWRSADRSLIAGDAFITTGQDAAYRVEPSACELEGPPAYCTADWDGARASLRRLAALEPELAVSMHGRPMRGEPMRRELRRLAADADRTVGIAEPNLRYMNWQR